MEPCEAAEADKEDHHQGQTQYGTSKVVEDLPATDGVHLILYLNALLVAYLVEQPADDLPVASGPAVVTLGIINIVGRVVVKQFQIVDQAAADMAAFDQVVAEDEVFREGTFQHLLEYL